MFGSAILLVGLGFIDCSQSALAIALLAAGVGISGSAYSGFLVNHMDIAPAYAGSLFGLTNCIGACSGFIAPSVAAALTTNVSRGRSFLKTFM
jgi:ACS family sodium-dependent inorganic phosphate cotransporter-like MFS transporter 5